MSILANQNIYGNATIRVLIDEPGSTGLQSGTDVSSFGDYGERMIEDAGGTLRHEGIVAPSQRSGAFHGPISYENDPQRGIARYYRPDDEAPDKTNRSSYAVPDNANGPYNGTSARNIVADDEIGTTRLSMMAKGMGAASVDRAMTKIGDDNLTVGNKQAVGLDTDTGGNTSRAALSFIGDGYTDWVKVGNIGTGVRGGVTKKSGGHDFSNNWSNTKEYDSHNYITNIGVKLQSGVPITSLY